MKRLRILYLVDSFNLGGAQEVIYNLVTSQELSLHTIQVRALHSDSVYGPKFRHASIDAQAFAISKYSPLIPFYVLRAIHSFQPDIIHCHLNIACLLGALSTKFFRLRLICHHHSEIVSFQSRATKVSARVFNSCADFTFFASAKARTHFCEKYQVPTHKSLHLVAGVPELSKYDSTSTLRKQLGYLDTDLVGIFCGRLNSPKRVDLLIRALSECDSSIKLLILGDGVLKASLQQLARTYHVEAQIQFLGYQVDPAKYYQFSDFLVLASDHEGFSLVQAEAFASKTALLTSKTGFAFTDSRFSNSCLFAEQSAESFASGFRKLCSTKLREQLITSGYTQYQKFLSVSKMAAAVNQIYQQF
jgi:glycosyltransferase involved in cell wall biosynthesis